MQTLFLFRFGYLREKALPYILSIHLFLLNELLFKCIFFLFFLSLFLLILLYMFIGTGLVFVLVFNTLFSEPVVLLIMSLLSFLKDFFVFLGMILNIIHLHWFLAISDFFENFIPTLLLSQDNLFLEFLFPLEIQRPSVLAMRF